MLKSNIIYTSNISSNNMNFTKNSSAVSDTLFDLMKENVLIVDTTSIISTKKQTKKSSKPTTKK